MIAKLTETIADHFRKGNLEWMTARDLSRRYGGTADHVKKIADRCWNEGLAITRDGKRGREYRSSMMGTQ
jgi:hypothetical protein